MMCSACFGRFLKFPACHSRRRVQVWKDEAQHPSADAEVAAAGGEPGSWRVSGDEGRKEVKAARGSEGRTRLPLGHFFWGCSLYNINLLWITRVSCSLFHLRLYSLFLTINNKTWSRELEDRLGVSRASGPLVLELVSLMGKMRWKSKWLAVLTPQLIVFGL